MTDAPEFTTETAREAAARDELAAWVKDFLASPGSDNAELGEHLAASVECWLGPVELPFDQLNRLAGPPEDPVLRPTEEHEWRDDVDDLAARIEDGLEPAPVVVAHAGDHLKLEDGNHRVEAARRAGRDRAWAVVGFSSDADRDRFVERAGET